MSVLDRKLKRDLLALKGVLAAVVAIIAIGITCFVAMASQYFNLESARREYYSQCRMADFSILLKKAPLLDVERLAGIPGISELRPRISFNVTVDLENVAKPISGRVLSLPEDPAPVINNIVLKTGGYFTGRRREEVIVNDAFARAHGVRPGDRIHLILNNRRQELFVVGTAISSEFVYLLGPGGLVPDPENYGVFYIPRRFAEEVFDFQGACNQIVGLLTPQSRDNPDEILDRIELMLEPYGVAATTPRSQQPSHVFLSSEIDGLKTMVTFLPTIFLTVAALILNVLMLRVAEQQRTVVGTLKALGYGNATLLVHYLKFGAVIGLVGGILGTACGYALGNLLTDVYRDYFEFPHLVNRAYPSLILAGLGISLGFSLVGTLRGVRTVMKLSPAEAMRPKPPRRGRRILLERFGVVWRQLGFRWQMVLRGIFRHRLRTIAGLFASAIGAGLILVTLYSRDSMTEMMSFQFNKVLLSDFELSFKDNRDAGALFESRRLPGVDYAEPVFSIGCTFHHGQRSKQGGITGILPHARLTVPRDIAGNRVAVPEVGLILTRKLAGMLDASPGDTLRVVPVTGRREPIDMPVAAVVDSYLGLAAYADFHYLNRLMGEEESLSAMQLKVEPGPESARKLYHELKRIPSIQAVNSVREQERKLDELLGQQMSISISVSIGFAGLIFFGSILNTSLISLSERQQEIAMFRVLGYGPWEAGSIFLRESLLVNIPGSLLGLPLGYWLSIQMGKMIDTEVFRMPFVIRPASWCLPVFLGILFTLLAHLPVQRAIHKMDMLQVLNVKE